ncbi:DUF636 domain protein [Hypoxylon fragiforme]|uniref:DUF636 domain protein n=1 Tax=Hypoxylon fragiforme TaxID=63214 RepID=UPI0020C5CDB0|nr:DUF636 domain protein [Hypoxylon fragiforme]KAI2608159.1 DUF636 domain protein [Hypoxylon fragiforme]
MANTSDLPAVVIPFYNRDKVIPPEPQEKQTFHARCHCGNVEFDLTIPTAILPLNAYICSCSSCRYTRGALCSLHVALPQTISPEWTNGRINVSVHKSPGSGAGGHGQRLFCPTCGVRVGLFEPRMAQWVVSTSLFRDTTAGPLFWSVTCFGFYKSPRDGGLLSWLPDGVGGKPLHLGTVPYDFPPDEALSIRPDGTEWLCVACFCGGVAFEIPRPAEAVRGDPHMARCVAPPLEKDNDEDKGEGKGKWKWKAYMDFGGDSWALSGAQGMPWVQVPRAVLSPAVPTTLEFGTVKTYKVSSTLTTGFCEYCGARVFLRDEEEGKKEADKGTEVLNVALGLLRAPEGAKAEDWVVWRAGRPEGVEEGKRFDGEFVDAMAEGMRRWGLDRYGEALEFDIV